jgi:4-hydroxy-tetrahydrodipicolinate synthase
MNSSPRKPVTGGLYVPVITPFDESEAVDIDAFGAVVSHILDGGVDGLVIAGSTGEAHALSFDERRELYTAAVELADGRVPVIAGTGATTTREAIRLTQLAADCNCDAALVLTPWFEPVTPDILDAYFTDVVSAETPLPVILYHNPSRTHVDWPVDHIAALVEKLGDRVIGLKDSSNDPDRVRAVRAKVRGEFLIFSGGAHMRAEMRAAGANGCIDTVANAHPLECAEAYAGDATRIELLAAINERLWSSGNPMGLLKHEMEALGLPAGAARKPFDVISMDDWAALKATVGRSGRLVAGEAGRPTDAVGVGGREVAHLMEPGVVDQAMTEPPLEAEAVELWLAARGVDHYSHHASITHFEGRYFASWSNGLFNEDSPGQIARYSTSDDGLHWAEPEPITPRDGKQIRTPGGFWQRDGKLWHLDSQYTRARYVSGEGTQGVCWEDLGTDGYEWTGSGWKPRGLILDDIYVNEAPRPLPDGEYMMTGVSRLHDALVAVGGRKSPDDWHVAVVNCRANTGLKMTEPSWFMMPDGRIRLLLRDDGGSRRLWTCTSDDLGRTWTEPQPTDIPDAGSKFFALPLPGGEIALVSNAHPPLQRRMLAVSISTDGLTFSRTRVLCCEPDIQYRLKGMHKALGFGYPNAVVADGQLWVVEGRNKEDIVLHSIDLADL